MNPIIGITGNEMTVNRPKDVAGFHINYSPRHFTQVVERAGGIPVIIPMTDLVSSEDYIQMIDGLILAGGQDISPHLYGEEPRAVMGQTSPHRDRNEIALIEAAIKFKKPILAICRGMQLINIYFGGSLYQDLSENPDITIQHVQKSQPHVVTHSIETKEDSTLYHIFGKKTQINSYHHQVIRKLGDHLIPTAHSSDGVIEAFESPENNIVAVQWHPELLYEDHSDSLNLFKDLIERAKA